MIQKIFKKFISALILFVAFFPWNLKAQIFKGTPDEGCFDEAGNLLLDEQGNPLSDAECGARQIGGALEGSGITGESDLGNLILKYVNFALPYLALAAFVGFIYAGFLYVTAYGNDEQVQKSKKILIYAIVGLVLVILSYSIVQLFTGELVEGIQEQ